MNIRDLRDKLGLTQEELANRLKVDRVTVAKWETTSRRPSRLAQRQIDRLERKALKATAK